jgi:hypothetical protein
MAWSFRPAAISAFRLKLEPVYLRALDALMLAADEYQIQAAMLRLRRAQARLHGWEVQGVTTYPFMQEESLPPCSLITALCASP